MATRKPLVLDAGTIEQLQPGDTMPGVGLFRVVAAKAADYAAVADDHAAFLVFSTAAILTLPAPATVPAGWTVGVRFDGSTGQLTVTADSGLISGGSLATLAPGQSAAFTHDGSHWHIFGDATAVAAFNYAYCCGGGGIGTYSASIERFAMAALASSVSVGTLTQARSHSTGCSDHAAGYGYALAGYNGVNVATVDRVQLQASANAASVGGLTVARRHHAAATDQGNAYGYAMGGYTTGAIATIDRIALTASASGAGVGSLSVARQGAMGCAHQAGGYGYCAGGVTSSSVIDRVQFAASASASGVGSLTGRSDGIGLDHEAGGYGYLDGGTTGTLSTAVERFAFASSTSAVAVGNLTVARMYSAGASDGPGGYGYVFSGYSGGGVYDVIDRHQFAASATGTDVGNLTVPQYAAAGMESQ